MRKPPAGEILASRPTRCDGQHQHSAGESVMLSWAFHASWRTASMLAGWVRTLVCLPS